MITVGTIAGACVAYDIETEGGNTAGNNITPASVKAAAISFFITSR